MALLTVPNYKAAAADLEAFRAAVKPGWEYVEMGGAVWMLDGDEEGAYLVRFGRDEHRATCPGCGDEWESTGDGCVIRSGPETFFLLLYPTRVECQICGESMRAVERPYGERATAVAGKV